MFPVIHDTNLIKVVCLNPKGALVVCDDADLDAVTDWIMVGIFLCTGQVCSATSRLIVQSSVRDAVIDRLVAKRLPPP